MTKVTLDTRTAGDHFGTEGLVRSARTGRILARTDVVPLGYVDTALARARAMADERGYVVVETE